MGALRELLVKLDVDIPKDKITGAGKAIEGLASSAKAFGGLLVGGAIVGGIKGFVGDLLQTDRSINDVSQRLGVSTDALQEWQFAAKRSGLEAEDMNTAFMFLQKNSGAAGDAGSAQAKAFKDLGVTLKGTNGGVRDSGDLMRDVGAAIAALPDQTSKTTAAISIFGRSGQKLLPLFNQGPEGLRQLSRRFRELGGGASKEALAAMGELGDAADDFELSISGLKATIGLQVLPAITRLVKGFADTTAAFVKSKRGPELIREGLIALGVTAGIVGAELLLPWVGLAVVLGALFLIIDDVNTGLKGGKSLTGEFLDTVFGKGTGDSVFASLRRDVKAFNEETKDLSWADKVEEGLARVGANLTKFFVEDVPEAMRYASRDASAAGREAAARWAEGFGDYLKEHIKDIIGGAFDVAHSTTVGKAGEDVGNAIGHGLGGRSGAELEAKADKDAMVRLDTTRLMTRTLRGAGAIGNGGTLSNPDTGFAQAVKAAEIRQNNAQTNNTTVNMTINGDASPDDVKAGVTSADEERRAAYQAMIRRTRALGGG